MLDPVKSSGMHEQINKREILFTNFQVEGPLNNLQPSYMTFARPRRNPAGDSRYAFTALARGGWDGHWDDRRHSSSNAHFRGNGGRRGRGRKDEQTDSRYDPRYSSLSASGYGDTSSGNGLPLPNFAPLPSYGGGDDMSSVGGDGSVFEDSSQYGGSQITQQNQRNYNNIGRGSGVYADFVGGGEYFSNDIRSQADTRSVADSIDSRRGQ